MELSKEDIDRNIYVYEPLHRHHSFKDELSKRTNVINKSVIKLAIKTRLFKKLNVEGKYLFDKSKIRLYSASRSAFNEEIPELINYTKIKLNTIHFYEVLEIDEFEKFEKHILKLVKSKANRKASFFISSTSVGNTKKSLASIKTSFDTITFGHFFSLNFKDNSNPEYALLDHLTFSYIKTHESYFIINLEIKPSALFHEYFKKIVSGEAGFIDYPYYNNIISILKGKWAQKYWTMGYVKGGNMENLFKDLNYQAQNFLRDNFRGIFLKASKKYYLPSIETFIVTNLDEFNKDRGLGEYFESRQNQIFTDEKKETEIIFPQSDKDAYHHNSIKIIFQKPENTKEESSGLEYGAEREFMQSLATPWILINILNLYWDNIASLKRKVYDFIKRNSKKNWINRVFRLFKIRRIIQLKYDLAKYRVIFTRFENEFNPEKLSIYTHRGELSEFRQKGSDKPEKNLHNYFQNRVKFPLTRLDKEIKIINENFTRIEEINSFRTNLFLQYASILLSLLALIFTFDKVKVICIAIWRAVEPHFK